MIFLYKIVDYHAFYASLIGYILKKEGVLLKLVTKT